MKIWSTPHGDMGTHVNYNGPKVGIPPGRQGELPPVPVTVRCAAGYVLEDPSIPRYSFRL